jgi:hypothetical protein
VRQPTKDSKGSLVVFKLKKICAKGHYYLQQAVTPDQITQHNNFAGGREGPNDSKGTLTIDFKVNT